MGFVPSFMTTHDLGRAYQHATHIAILDRGKIGYYGPTSAMTADQLPRIYAETIRGWSQPHECNYNTRNYYHRRTHDTTATNTLFSSGRIAGVERFTRQGSWDAN